MPSTRPTKIVGRAIQRASWLIFALTLIVTSASAQTTNLLTSATNAPAAVAAPLELPLPSAGPSIIRVLGALALVLGIFFGGVWLFRNWQRLTIQRGHAPKLNVLETRPLGGKHALYVIGYEQERFLLSSSPTGVTLITHLPQATEKDSADTTAATPAPPSFAQALTRVLKGK
jgi:flagellar biogenesis protein FliO